MNDDAQRYDPREIGAALNESRDRLEDLADRIEVASGRTLELSQTDKLLVWLSLKMTLLSDCGR